MMKAPNAENLCLESRKHAFVFLLSILVMRLVVHLSKAASTDDNINFSFTRFNQTTPEMVYESDASASNQCTGSNGNGDTVGRATYYKPMHLWDNSSGNLILADFTTQFTFSIGSSQGGMSGDGFAFFLAPGGTKIPPDAGGGCLGLQSRCYKGNDSCFVAVEFDTYNQLWDPPGMSVQVGIDLNNVTTPLTAIQWWWLSDSEDRRKVYAFIRYNSSTRNLSVLIDFDDSTAQNSSNLSTTLDLSLYLPEWVTFGFSGATGGDSNELHTIYSWNFSSRLQVSRPLNTSTNPPPTEAPAPAKIPSNPSGRKSRTWLWVVLAIAGVISALLPGLGSVWFFCRRRKYSSREDGTISVNVQMEMVTAPRQFSYMELRLATNNFSDEGMLGEGGSDKEFLIVYEFLPNKSLDYHLHREPCLLTWDKRYKIARGLASAVFYLQEQCDQCVLHRDIKSSNVLLDLSFNAKLGDFGLARLVEHGQGSRTTQVMLGTDGYIAPECLDTYRAVKESDIYSFGIVILEIATGKKAIAAHERHSKKSRTKLVEWVWELYGKESLVDAADIRLYGNYDMEQMERLLLVGLACAHPGYFVRPSITQVIDILGFKAPCPMVPREMPLPTFGSALEDNSVASSAFISSRTGGCSRSQSLISGPSVRVLKDKGKTRSVAGSDMEAGQSYVVGT
ncbi:putative Concanavalin A-like lectin protein kinase family protein [Hibiscus syriacus]|uniref:non-specific serine/threonine protein kinase n=1 Tax=Hibiscus syriacus TaxID=106335 RepID=A0A6A2WMD4_HIBSY|nr:putative Concanavalin A-like lectin protein kinase family protein [Hibiscus syriacus]